MTQTAPADTPLPALTGSRQQIAAAEQIRRHILDSLAALAAGHPNVTSETQGDALAALYRRMVLRITRASDWTRSPNNTAATFVKDAALPTHAGPDERASDREALAALGLRRWTGQR